MHWAEKFLGSPSKYATSLPYTYEARVSVLEWADAYNSYYSDTLCGLIDFLRQKNISPTQVTLYEVYRDHEAAVATRVCLDEHEMWLSRPKLCKALRKHYAGHIADGHCALKDRSRMAYGA